MDKEKQIVEEFSRYMYEKLQMRHTRYAPLGWQTLDIKRLIILLEEEIKELKERHATTPESFGMIESTGTTHSMMRANMQDNAIDIGNYAMFIWSFLELVKD